MGLPQKIDSLFRLLTHYLFCWLTTFFNDSPFPFADSLSFLLTHYFRAGSFFSGKTWGSQENNDSLLPLLTHYRSCWLIIFSADSLFPFCWLTIASADSRFSRLTHYFDCWITILRTAALFKGLGPAQSVSWPWEAEVTSAATSNGQTNYEPSKFYHGLHAQSCRRESNSGSVSSHCLLQEKTQWSHLSENGHSCTKDCC